MELGVRGACVCGTITDDDGRKVFVKVRYDNRDQTEVRLATCLHRLWSWIGVKVLESHYLPFQGGNTLELSAELNKAVALLRASKVKRKNHHRGISVIVSEYIHNAVPLENIEKIPESEHAAIYLQVMLGLDVLSRNGFVHGDLHWGNILCEPLDHPEPIIFYPQPLSSTSRKRTRRQWEEEEVQFMTSYRVRFIDAEFAIKFAVDDDEEVIANPTVLSRYGRLDDSIIFTTGKSFAPNLEWSRFLFSMCGGPIKTRTKLPRRVIQRQQFLPADIIAWTEQMINDKEYDDYGVLLKYGDGTAIRARRKSPAPLPSDPPPIQHALCHIALTFGRGKK